MTNNCQLANPLYFGISLYLFLGFFYEILLLGYDPDCAETRMILWTTDNRCSSTNNVYFFQNIYINNIFPVRKPSRCCTREGLAIFNAPPVLHTYSQKLLNI
jgi:hypothetical protein